MKLVAFVFAFLTLSVLSYSIELTGFYGWDTSDKTELKGISGAWKFTGNLYAEIEAALFGKDEKSILGGFSAGSRISDVFPYIFLGTGWKDMMEEGKESMKRYWSYGGGVKLKIVEKLWLRFDYRNMRFSSIKKYRLYGGLTYSL